MDDPEPSALDFSWANEITKTIDALKRSEARLQDEVASLCRSWEGQLELIAQRAEKQSRSLNSLGEVQGNTYRIDTAIASLKAATELRERLEKLLELSDEAAPKKKAKKGKKK